MAKKKKTNHDSPALKKIKQRLVGSGNLRRIRKVVSKGLARAEREKEYALESVRELCREYGKYGCLVLSEFIGNRDVDNVAFINYDGCNRQLLAVTSIGVAVEQPDRLYPSFIYFSNCSASEILDMLESLAGLIQATLEADDVSDDPNTDGDDQTES